jgi:hypothetical protein
MITGHRSRADGVLEDEMNDAVTRTEPVVSDMLEVEVEWTEAGRAAGDVGFAGEATAEARAAARDLSFTLHLSCGTGIRGT